MQSIFDYNSTFESQYRQQQQQSPRQAQSQQAQSQSQSQQQFDANARQPDRPCSEQDAYQASSQTPFDSPACNQRPENFSPNTSMPSTQAPPPQYSQFTSGHAFSTNHQYPEQNENAPENSFEANHVRTGVNAYELARIFQHLRQHHPNNPVVFASPRGGPVPFEPHSYERYRNDSQLREYFRNNNLDIRRALSHTVPVSWVQPEEYGAAICVGSQGALWDFATHADVAAALYNIYERNKGTIAAIGHGLAALLNVPNQRPAPQQQQQQQQQSQQKEAQRRYMVENRCMACFTANEEREFAACAAKAAAESSASSSGPTTRRREAASQRQKEPSGACPSAAESETFCLPYNMEEEFRKRGARVESVKPFEPQVVNEGRLVTAQNEASTQRFMEEFSRSFA